MSNTEKKQAAMKNVIILLLLIGYPIILAVASQIKQPVSTYNSAALQSCIQSNVDPLEHLASINPNPQGAQAEVNAANTALESCKTQYPAQ